MSLIRRLERMIANKFGISSDLFQLFKLEAKLAGMSLPSFMVYLGLLIPVAISLWLSLMILLGYGVYLATQQPVFAIAAVFILNLLITILLLIGLKRRSQEMSFARTRDCLKKPQTENESEPTEERTVAIHK